MATVLEQEVSAIHIRVPTPLKEQVDRQAKADKRTLAATVELALEEFLERRRAEKTKKR